MKSCQKILAKIAKTTVEKALQRDAIPAQHAILSFSQRLPKIHNMFMHICCTDGWVGNYACNCSM